MIHKMWGYYCYNCEEWFFDEDELDDDGNCPICSSEAQYIDERDDPFYDTLEEKYL